MSKKRDRMEIIKDILETIRDKGTKVRPTHIMYRANLSHQMLNDYTDELLLKKMVKENLDKKGKRIYELTDKGHNYLKDYNIIRKFADSYGFE